MGNVDALGEYNVWADPEAAAIVFAAPGRKTMIGWNISRTFAVVDPDEQAAAGAAGPLGAFAVGINGDVDQYCLDTGLAGFDLPDPVAMAVALDDTIVTESTDEWLVIGLDGPTRGAARCRIAASSGPSRTSAWCGRSTRPRSSSACSTPAGIDRRRTACAGAGRSAAIHSIAAADDQSGRRAPGSGASVRVRFSSKNESMSIIVTSASHIATLFSVGGTFVMTGPK